ncbi:MAG: hypothetical protein ACYCYP_10265 [Leptospirales bacterium]
MVKKILLWKSWDFEEKEVVPFCCNELPVVWNIKNIEVVPALLWFDYFPYP